MEHLILVPVIFPGEKTQVSRPGAVPRLSCFMIQGHSIKQALSEQRTLGFLGLETESFRAGCLFFILGYRKGNQI